MPRADVERGDTFHDLLAEYVTFDSEGWAYDLVHRAADRLQADVAPGDRISPEVVWLEGVTAFTLPGRHVYFVSPRPDPSDQLRQAGYTARA
jgi:hypothetical protein